MENTYRHKALIQQYITATTENRVDDRRELAKIIRMFAKDSPELWLIVATFYLDGEIFLRHNPEKAWVAMQAYHKNPPEHNALKALIDLTLDHKDMPAFKLVLGQDDEQLNTYKGAQQAARRHTTRLLFTNPRAWWTLLRQRSFDSPIDSLSLPLGVEAVRKSASSTAKKLSGTEFAALLSKLGHIKNPLGFLKYLGLLIKLGELARDYYHAPNKSTLFKNGRIYDLAKAALASGVFFATLAVPAVSGVGSLIGIAAGLAIKIIKEIRLERALKRKINRLEKSGLAQEDNTIQTLLDELNKKLDARRTTRRKLIYASLGLSPIAMGLGVLAILFPPAPMIVAIATFLVGLATFILSTLMPAIASFMRANFSETATWLESNIDASITKVKTHLKTLATKIKSSALIQDILSIVTRVKKLFTRTQVIVDTHVDELITHPSYDIAKTAYERVDPVETVWENSNTPARLLALQKNREQNSRMEQPSESSTQPTNLQAW